MPLTIPEAAQQFIDDQVKFHGIVNGPASGSGSTVVTEGGTVKSVAKLIGDLDATASAAVESAKSDAISSINTKVAAVETSKTAALSDISADVATVESTKSSALTSIAADVAAADTDAGIFHDIVHGPASGPGSTVATDNGPVDTLAKRISAIETTAVASAAAADASADDAEADRVTVAADKAAVAADKADVADDKATVANDKDTAVAAAATATAQAGIATAAASALSAATAGRRTVRAAHASNVTISNPGTSSFGGVNLTSGERVLLWGQSSGLENGIYDFNGSSSAMTRSADSDSSAEMAPGIEVQVMEGTYAKKAFLLTTIAPITLNTTALVFELPSVTLGRFRRALLSTAGSSATFGLSKGASYDTTTGELMMMSADLAKTTSGWGVGNAGSLDTGTIETGKFYTAYMIKRPDTGVVDALTSLAPGTSGAATISNASPGVVTWTDHGLQANCPITFETTGALPTGLVVGTQYFVKTVNSADAFTVSATQGGAAINTSSAGSGTHTAVADPIMPANYTLKCPQGAMLTNGSSQWVKFHHNDDEFVLDTPVFDALSVTPANTNAALVTLSVPKGVKVRAKLLVAVSGVGGSFFGVVTSPDQADLNGGTFGYLGVGAASEWNSVNYDLRTDRSGRARFRFSSTTGYYTALLYGWLDPRGRNG